MTQYTNTSKRLFVGPKFKCCLCFNLNHHNKNNKARTTRGRWLSFEKFEYGNGVLITKNNISHWRMVVGRTKRLHLGMRLCSQCCLRFKPHLALLRRPDIGTYPGNSLEVDKSQSIPFQSESKVASTLPITFTRESRSQELATAIPTNSDLSEFELPDLNAMEIDELEGELEKIGLSLFSKSVEVLSEEEKRQVLDGRATIEELVNRMKENQYNKIIVVAGAGISVSAGIPDFRTKGIGLYHTLEKNYGFKLSQPEDIFDIHYFRNVDPKPFFTLAKELMPNAKNPKYKPTLTHQFLKELHNRGLLLRCYTQNIDGLERLAGIPPEKLVEAHGTFSSASCIDCHKAFDIDSFVRPRIQLNKLPFCDQCNTTEDTAVPYKGLVKPDIVFFGEDLPNRFYEMSAKDFKEADLLIVLGTSLQVYPVAGLVHKMSPRAPRLLINMNVVGVFDKDEEQEADNYRDICLLGPCDSSCHKLMKLLEWSSPPRSNKKKEPTIERRSNKSKKIMREKENTQTSNSRSWVSFLDDLAGKAQAELQGAL